MKGVCASIPLFGGRTEIEVFDTEEHLARNIIEEASQEAAALQQTFNMYDPKSELSLLNKERVRDVSGELLLLIKKSLAYSKKTHGEYDITLGKSIIERKNSGSFIKHGCSYKDVDIKGNIISLNHPDALLDLGSIAKGHITDRIAEYLLRTGIKEFLIDARGDIRLVGKKEHEIGVQHPRDKNKNICTLKLKNCSVATSGDYHQFYKEYTKSHIINQKDLISVTVISKNLQEADAYATMIFVSDKKIRKELIKNNSRIKVITIDTNLRIRYYNGCKDLIKKEKKKKSTNSI